MYLDITHKPIEKTTDIDQKAMHIIILVSILSAVL